MAALQVWSMPDEHQHLTSRMLADAEGRKQVLSIRLGTTHLARPGLGRAPHLHMGSTSRPAGRCAPQTLLGRQARRPAALIIHSVRRSLGSVPVIYQGRLQEVFGTDTDTITPTAHLGNADEAPGAARCGPAPAATADDCCCADCRGSPGGGWRGLGMWPPATSSEGCMLHCCACCCFCWLAPCCLPGADSGPCCSCCACGGRTPPSMAGGRRCGLDSCCGCCSSGRNGTGTSAAGAAWGSDRAAGA